MPAPVSTAPDVASTAAPGYVPVPATTPTTPRVYLWSPGPGTGQSSATSAASSRSTRPAAGSAAPQAWRVPAVRGAAPGVAGNPMSTSSTAPATPAAGGRTRPGLRAPKVTVRS